MQKLIAEYPAELFQRAADYLYLKETKSTYRIENEDLPPKERTQKFLRLLMTAGDEPVMETLKEEKLAQRQNAIVDTRYAEPGFRAIQNYVGENRPWGQKVHYLCPPPDSVASLMEGLRLSSAVLEKEHPAIQAAAMAFGFVFIHPFEDGNGRLHRFLIHDTLHRRRMVPAGVTLPISATMLRHRAAYDGALEAYSTPLVEPGGLAHWHEDADGAITLLNKDAIDHYYRFPDLTAQTKYLLETLELTVQEDFAYELRFLQKFDAARESIREIVDLPDRRLDLLLKLLHQNKGILAARKREDFSELSHAELESIEHRYQEAFQ
jgi:Fic family protein